MEHLLEIKSLDRQKILDILDKAESYYELASGKGYSQELKGKILASLFYQPSTRTRLSTETAMLRLGGQVITSVGIESSSLTKGETLRDTAKVVSCFADIAAIRHSEAGSAVEFAEGSSIPVINCGDGSADHPTQALLEAYTMYKHFGRLDGLTVAYVGDLKHSRTSNSLLALFSKFGGTARLLAPEGLSLQDDFKFGEIEYVETGSLEEVVQDADVIYSSRIRREYFDDEAAYNKLRDSYVFDLKFLESNCPDSILLHALPRVDEIDPSADNFKGSLYFDAVTNGVAVRMALISMLCS